MKTIGASVVLWFLCVATATAGSLSTVEADALRADVSAMAKAFDRGDAEHLIAKTHASVHALAGGEGEFARVLRQGAKDLQNSGVVILSSDVGIPTRTYSAGDEEVCFVPRESIVDVKGTKVRSITFMVAIRKVGAAEWTYLEGAGLRKNPELIYKLLPELERNISFPPNTIELM